MATKWTNDQQKVIDERNKDILVSAAAGSGKTAVLVERIIGLITRGENPIDVDKLLVVTFTKAAAAEMKERIFKAIEDEFKKNPSNEHLERQLTYVHNAQITTIDSFCLSVVRNNFNLIGLDPSFRIGDNDELELLKNDVLQELIEEYYDTADEEFLSFIDQYVSKQGKLDIDKSIFKLFNISTSYPYPEKWLMSLIENYKDVDEDKLINSEWFNELFADAKGRMQEIIILYNEMIEICKEEYGPHEYLENIENEKKAFNDAVLEHDMHIFLEKFGAISFDRLPSISKKRDVDEILKKQITDNRNKIKKEYGTIATIFDTNLLGDEIELLNNVCKDIEILIKLVIDFGRKYLEKKKEKNLVDFSDVLHYALEILVEEQDGKSIPTTIAKEMSEDFYEIMIDEYQDSNYVQEAILTSVSKKHKGINNIFMVGDVKQSIYRFRQARPDLFIEKYNNFSTNGNEQTKICLSKNFRSRKEVLDTCNLVFSQLMTKDFGGIEYGDAEALHLGATDYCEYNTETEILIIDNNGMDSDEIGEDYVENVVEDEISKEEVEAHAVANKIIQMVKSNTPYMVQDKQTKQMRNIRYSDIVILARSGKKIGELFARVLQDCGIPAECENTTGYFDTFEINTILNYVRIVDNVRQDIPLVSVLRNVYGFNENELAIIKGNKGKELCFYDSIKQFLLEDYFDKQLVDKTKKFIDDINKYRDIATYTPIYQLINMIINETGFIDFVTAMEGGKKKLANIEMLLEKALIYENTSLNGLFDFARYIEKIKKFEIDSGESAITDNAKDTVKIMTIHKSKGLEFPVVFLVATGRKFNDMDSKDKIVVNDKVGFGMDYTDMKKGMKHKSLIKKAVNLMNVLEDKAEELRILYVALTRAKEKLIITANVDIESKLKKMYVKASNEDIKFTRNQILSANSYFEWILLALIRHKSSAELLREYSYYPRIFCPIYEYDANIKIKTINIRDIVFQRLYDEIVDEDTEKALRNFDASFTYDIDKKEELQERMSFEYKYAMDLLLKAKVSVSEIKHANMKKAFDEHKEDVLYMPAFLNEAEENRGALRGTAYHRVFELFDYSMEVNSVEDIKKMFDAMIESKKISKEMMDLVDKNKMYLFAKTNLAKRMKNAYQNNTLMREKAFVMGIDPRLIYKDINSDEHVLVQGIIDALFIENDEVVIVDYKTDSVEKLSDLEDRYKAQLELYGNAVKESLGKKVKELIIYSTKFGDELVMEYTGKCVEVKGE